ncbi:MAG: phenylalanine--tRNA ligase subunit beta [Mariprofundaceae bacterium]|nr:phenylalanine--tRNA ligase subunit beta [Mariprofundaceae bacterium]
MKLPLSWLLEHVALTCSIDAIAKALTDLGIEVEGIDYPAASIEGVLVGQIQSMQPHPNADRLRLLQVDVAGDQPLAIVCGASNMVEGDKIALATVGTYLPGDFKIKRGKIRGEVSLGMCCSEVELGLADEAEGILILDSSTEVGSDVSAYLGLETAILDLSITPNRGDCMSVYGLARELGAYFDVPLTLKSLEKTVFDADVATPVVHIEDQDDCPLYMAQQIEGVVLTDSPQWLAQRLQACGMRTVNGVVDVMNYVMLEIGQPMHAFDRAMVKGDLYVRRANAESMKGLDERELSLNAEHLVVADDQEVIAVAGVMGSLSSGVTAQTTSLILESAVFQAARVSTVARQYGSVTEASMRFERGVDRAQTAVALQRATSLITTLFGGRVSAVEQCGDGEWTKHKIQFPISAIAKRLGIDVPESTDLVLQGMGFSIERDESTIRVSVPAHRHDVRLVEDVIEEYARIYGYDHIPTVLPAIAMNVAAPAPKRLLDHVVAQGFTQVINYAFISEKQQRLFSSSPEKDVRLLNPISAEMSVMRHSLFPSLLANAQYNLNRQQSRVCLVEEGRSYFSEEKGFQEVNQLSLLWAGEAGSDRWYQDAKSVDFFDVKGVVETVLKQMGQLPRWQACDDIQGLQAGQTAVWQQGKRRVAVLAKVSRGIAKSYDLDGDVFVAEINLDMLSQSKKPAFKALAQHPSVTRDLVFLFSNACVVDDILAVARKASGKALQDVRIFDRYDGQGVAEGFVSLGIRLTLQANDRTLQQAEVDDIAKKVVTMMAKKFSAQQR